MTNRRASRLPPSLDPATARAARHERLALPKLASIALLPGMLILTLVWPPRPVLLWNRSASSPTGLYLLSTAEGLRPGDHIAAWAPGWARRLGAERHYIPANIPLLKKIAAVPGDSICLRGNAVFVLGSLAGRRLRVDPAGRPMPWSTSCKMLGQDEFFLFDPSETLAFDGRYFGITKADDIVAKARLVWPA